MYNCAVVHTKNWIVQTLFILRYELEAHRYNVDNSIEMYNERIDTFWSHVIQSNNYPMLSCYIYLRCPLVESLFSLMKSILNEYTTRLDIDTVSSLQTVKYCIKSRAGSAREYYGDLSLKLNATHLLVKNMKLASIERTQEQSLVRKT